MRLTHRIHQYIETMWWQKSKPAAWLRGLSHIYAKCADFDQQKRLNQAISSSIPLISIGNITVGGSGKTPFTIWLAQQLLQRDYKPVILCRGDGGNHTSKPKCITEHDLAADVGDEAVLLHQLSYCPVIAGRDRVTAANMAADYGDVILLDDGFQYRQLMRQCDIVLIPEQGLGNGALIPAGPLREPIQALKRADILVRTNASQAPTLTHSKEWHWHSIEKPLHDWMQCQQPAPQEVIALTAIARPKRFMKSLEQLNVQVIQSHFFPDHHPFSQQDIAPLINKNIAIAVTAKDAVKLLPLWPKNTPLWVLEQGSTAENGLIEAILSRLAVGTDTAR